MTILAQKAHHLPRLHRLAIRALSPPRGWSVAGEDGIHKQKYILESDLDWTVLRTTLKAHAISVLL